MRKNYSQPNVRTIDLVEEDGLLQSSNPTSSNSVNGMKEGLSDNDKDMWGNEEIWK